LGGYLSGNWYNPEQDGHGFQLEFTNAIDQSNGLPIALAIWFVYTPDGTGQNWIFAQGTYDGTKSAVTLSAMLFTGPNFPPNYNPADLKTVPADGQWGTLTFTFSDCNHGTVMWHSDLAGYNSANDVPLPIVRITQIAGTSCPQ
jgi:hypothetical protein